MATTATDFTVTVTEILGTDSMNNSRVTINRNFQSLATSVNTIYNQYFSGGNMGNVNTDIIGNDTHVKNVFLPNNGTLSIGNASLNEETLQRLLDSLEE